MELNALVAQRIHTLKEDYVLISKNYKILFCLAAVMDIIAVAIRNVLSALKVV